MKFPASRSQRGSVVAMRPSRTGGSGRDRVTLQGGTELRIGRWFAPIMPLFGQQWGDVSRRPKLDIAVGLRPPEAGVKLSRLC